MGGLSPWVSVSSGTEITGFLLCQPVLYAAQGSLSGGGDISDAGHGEDGEVFGHVP